MLSGALGADTDLSSCGIPFDVIDVENDALSLPEGPEDASVQRGTVEQDLSSTRV